MTESSSYTERAEKFHTLIRSPFLKLGTIVLQWGCEEGPLGRDTMPWLIRRRNDVVTQTTSSTTATDNVSPQEHRLT